MVLFISIFKYVNILKFFYNIKAISIKCFVSDRLTDPFFWKSRKKNSICKEASTLVYTNCLKLSSTLHFCSLFRHLVVLFLLELKDHITKVSYLAARPSLALRTLHVFFLFFFCPTDRPTFMRGRAMGNETFYWDGLTIIFYARLPAAVQEISPCSFPEGMCRQGHLNSFSARGGGI